MSGYVGIDGLEAGPTLVMVHGAGANRKMWLPEIECLSDRYRIVTLDLPGHGARMDEKYDYFRSVASVDDVIEEHTTGPVVLVGLSLGGYVAMAARHPRIAGLVLSGSTIAYSGWGGFSTKLYGMALAPFTRFVRKANEKALRKALPPEMADDFIAHGLSLKSATMALRTMAGHDYRAILSEVECPVLILNGERDKGNRAEEDDAAAVAKDVTIVMVEDSGHACSLTQPEAFSESIHTFCTTRALAS